MKRTIILLFSLMFVIPGVFYFVVYPKFEIISGYNAKILCSCLFVTGISQQEAETVELGFGPLWLASNKVNLSEKTVQSSVWGMHPKKAVYREGLGCALVHNADYDVVREQKFLLPDSLWGPDIFPERQVAPTGALLEALQSAFDAPGDNLLNTRAVLVLKHGRLIGEMYGAGVDHNTPLLGWSMMKSVNGALVGLLAKDGKWQLDSPAPLPGWQVDDRKKITMRHLMNMTDGIDWQEDYGTVSTATVMLYGMDEMGTFAAERPQQHTPGQQWKYSSGTSNILAMLVAHQFADRQSYWHYAYSRLFGPLGMRRFTAETDASGIFVGSSYGYGSARDWARFALLYLNKGNWQGEQLLDPEWVQFSATTIDQSEGFYGGQFWTNGNGRMKYMAAGDYWLDGFQGQQVSIHPAEDLVIVRLGVTYDESNFDFDGWIGRVMAAAQEVEMGIY